MILICSDKRDKSSNLLQDWLIHYKIKFLRISDTDLLQIRLIDKMIFLQYLDVKFTLEDIVGLFSRGSRINFKELSNKSYFKNEQKHLIDYIYYKIGYNLKVNLSDNQINKLIVSDLAKKNGFLIPKQWMLDNVKDLEKSLILDKALCTKSISGINIIDYGKTYKSLYTIKLNSKQMKMIKGTFFFPSLVQQYIEKKFEIRSFFFNDDVYSMAIFSQNNEESKEDYRRNYHNSDIKTSLFKLPIKIKNNIIALMKELNLNSGSIDLIYSKDKKFYFLEVNPTGQFSFLSEECNYNIENEIVKSFINL